MTPRAPARVGIIGGGTAGYLSALALRIQRPELELTLIESSRVPVIGVGEGTTPIMVPFLHGYLGFDVQDFFEQVRPTWKLGVRLEWGTPGDDHFNFPFDANHTVESYCYTGDINSASLGSRLMESRASVHLRDYSWRYETVAANVPFAYHLDNKRFVIYLKRQAEAMGISCVDALIAGAERGSDGNVASVIADDGRRFEFDLFVDCSGFRSLLLGEVLGVEAISYSSSLFTDAALVADQPHDAPLAPFTTATTMSAGWCWSVPQEQSDHRGYVFCSDFISADEAAREMAQRCPGMAAPRQIRFRPHRRRAWWKHNVVGIGNAYGFVEPLQATALHMIVRQIVYLVASFERASSDLASPEQLNDSVATIWDNVAGLIALHYKFNRRYDTRFWQAARARTRLGPLESVVEAALSCGPEPVPRDGQADGILLGGLSTEVDLLLLGMNAFEPATVRPAASSSEWRRRVDRHQRLLNRALSARDSLALARTGVPPDASGGRWYEGFLSGLQRPVH